MIIQYDIERLREVMSDYASVSGLGIAVVDTDFNYLVLCTYKPHEFCLKINETKEGLCRCNCSDLKLLQKCREKKAFVSHICHAGLTDAAYPIIKNDIILGYIILGRMRTNSNFSDIRKRLSWMDIDFKKLSAHYNQLSFFESERVHSVANIASIIAAYILTDNIIKPEYNNIIKEVVRYIDENLSSDLSVQILCSRMNISKNLLYKNFHLALNCPVNEYIINQRIERAKHLLKTTALSVSEISDSVGINDYTYFCRLFKKKTTFSPMRYRKLHLSV